MSSRARRVRPVEVHASGQYRIWLRYEDGVEGEVDLSHLAGDGVFVAWENREFFSGVRLGPGTSIAWGDDLDLCGDALYMKITGMTPQEMFPALFADADA